MNTTATRTSALLLALMAAPSLLGQQGCPQDTETQYIPMRDGITLATDVFEKEEPAPTIVMRTPYGKNSNIPYSNLYGEQGYALVSQDLRGSGGSGGIYLSPFDDAWGANQDGYDTIEWAAAGAWSNGDVCLSGYSALSIASLAAVGAAPPSLRCVYSWVGTSDIYGVAVWQGGAFRESLVSNWLLGLGFVEAYNAVHEAPLSTDPLWANVRLQDVYDRVNVPIYHVGGWFDIFAQSTLDTFAGIQAQGDEGARGRQKLMVGPWNHDHFAGELEFVDAGHPSGEDLRFFAHHLKGEANGIDAEPPVRYYLMGDADLGHDSVANRWVDATTWPPPSTPTAFHLRADGALTRAAPGQEAADAYTFDPADPVETWGGSNLFLESGSTDQIDYLDRPDVLLYETEPLTAPVVVAGRLKTRLYVSSSATDTDFTVKLMDVYPDGRYMLMQDGILRMRFREGQDREVAMVPGEIYGVEVDLWSTALAFEPGHRIAIAVSSSNYPRFDVNPNNGLDLSVDGPEIVADQRIYHDGAHPSALILPVIELP